MVDADELADLSRKLTITIRLIAYQISEGMTVTDGAPLLDRLGVGVEDIAVILDTTPNTARARISEHKKKSS